MAEANDRGEGGAPAPDRPPEGAGGPEPTLLPAEERVGDVSAQLSRLLADLAAAPPAEIGAAWKRTLAIGDQVGRFRLERELGRGGFGVVWEASDVELNRTVAFKAIRAGAKVAMRSEEWLVREAEAVARLHHPNIVTLHDIGKADTGPYLIFERLRGETLAERMKKGPLPLREVLRIGTDVARALAHAHAEDVIHRDLKPANVFLCDDGTVKVLDFGLAYLFGRGGPASAGTPAYMAPEQWRSQAGDGRIDLFALGCILFQLLAGQPPYKVTARGSDALVAGAPPPLPGRGVPGGLRRVVLRCIEPDPDRRPVSSAVVLRDLEEVSRSVANRARRVRVYGAVAAALLLGATGVWAYDNYSTSTGPRITVAVADVANETGDPALDGLSGLLTTSLEQSRRLQVLSKARMLDLARQAGAKDASRIDEVVGQAVAKQAQAKALLLASVHRFEEVYAIELRALEPGARDYLFTLQEKAPSRAGIPAAIDRLSARARRALSERKGDLRQASVEVAAAVTPDVDAYGLYYQGQECEAHPSHHASWLGVYAETCIPFYEKAVAKDPSFALAWYRLARLGTMAGTNFPIVGQALGEAIRHIDRAPPREQALIRALEAEQAKRPEEALAIYQRLLAEGGDDKELLFFAADRLQQLGRPAEVTALLERRLHLDPASESALQDVVEALGAEDRVEDLRARIRQLQSLPVTPGIRHALVYALIEAGDPEGAVKLAREGALASEAGPSDLRFALAAAGRYAEVEALQDEAAERRPLTWPERRARLIALLARGKVGEARQELLAYQAGLRAMNPPALIDAVDAPLCVLAGYAPLEELRAHAEASREAGAEANGPDILAYRGDLAGAAREARAYPPSKPLGRYYPAIVAWKEGRLEEATALLRELERTWPVYAGYLPGPYLPSFLLAEVRTDAGDPQGALEAVARWRRTLPYGLFRGPLWPRSLFLEAQALERLGRREEARAAIDRFLALWHDADPGIPLHAEAKALRARL